MMGAPNVQEPTQFSRYVGLGSSAEPYIIPRQYYRTDIVDVRHYLPTSYTSYEGRVHEYWEIVHKFSDNAFVDFSSWLDKSVDLKYQGRVMDRIFKIHKYTQWLVLEEDGRLFVEVPFLISCMVNLNVRLGHPSWGNNECRNAIFNQDIMIPHEPIGISGPGHYVLARPGHWLMVRFIKF